MSSASSPLSGPSRNKAMDRKQDFWSWWCYRAWILFGLCITSLMTILILVFWNDWSVALKVMAAISALVPVHVVEEWVFPGGFHYQYNTFVYRSKLPDRYPMSRLTDMMTNLLATFLYAFIVCWYALSGEQVPATLVLMTIGFCTLEVIIHTTFGVMAWLRFRNVGKTTIYGPGSITAYLGFGLFGAILCYTLPDYTLTSYDWWIGAIELVAMLTGIVIIPETAAKSRNTRFIFPSAGYYDRYLEKK